MKKIIFTLLILSNIGFCNNYDFKKGFEAGLQILEFQRQNEGIKPKNITITKPYAVIINISNYSTSEVLFMQNVAYREGLNTYLTKDFLFFGDFDRKADAINCVDKIKKDLEINATIKETKNKMQIITYPNLWAESYLHFFNEVKKQGYIVNNIVIEKPVTKIIKIKPKPVIAKKEEPKKIIVVEPQKIMTLKNQKAMSYILNGDNKNSKNFKENQFLSGQFILENENMIKTDQGEVFYKVKNENLYFNQLDVGKIK